MSKAADQIMAILEGLEAKKLKLVLAEVGQRLSALKKSEKPPKAAKTNSENVWKLFNSKIEAGDSGYTAWLSIDDICEGFSGVDFDLENAEYKSQEGVGNWGTLLGPRMFGKVAGIGCFAGGDWEWPIFFVIYLDRDGKTFRSYVPKNGNTYNYELESAFGNNEEKDVEFLAKWLKQNHPEIKFDLRVLDPATRHGGVMFNEQKILKDIAENVLVGR